MLGLPNGRKKVTGYWRRGTFNDHLAYNRVTAHERTANPAPRTMRPPNQVDSQGHSVVQQCKLPKPKDAVKMAQRQPKLARKGPIDVD